MNENLKEWARSFSGCDGGNPNADIWLCGIEWGYAGTKDEDKEKRENYYKNELPEEIKKGAIELDSEKFNWKDSINYTYGRSFAKLYTTITNGKVEDYANVKNLTGDELFKLNLYPIAFNSTNHNLWEYNKLNKVTGFKSKYLFNTWCFFNRSQFYVEIRKYHNPKLIICTGVNYLRDFLMFFGGNNIDKLKTKTIKAKSKANTYNRTYYYVKIEKTLLVVIPFFSGRYGLNSNYLLQKMGEEIAKLLKP